MDAKKRGLLIVFLTVVIDLLGFGVVLPLLPRYGERLEAGPATVGMLMASFSAMQFLFTPVWGRLSDRVGRRPILILGLAGSVVFYALFGYASRIASLWLMFFSRMGAGISGATIATAQAYIADSTPPERRGKGMALIGAAFGIGFTFGPLLGAAALKLDPGSSPIPLTASSEIAIPIGEAPDVDVGRLSPAPGYLASGLSALALLLAIFILPESLRPDSRAPRHDWFDAANFKVALNAPTVAQLILVFFVATMSFAMFESTLALVNQRVFALEDVDNFYLFGFTGLTLMLAQGIVVRRVSGKIADEKLVKSGVVLLIAGLVGLVFGAVLRSMGLFLTMLVAVVLGFSLMTTSLQALISKRSRPDQQGGILGVNQSGSALARILGPVTGIWLFGRVDPNAPYWCSVLLLGVSFALLLRIPALEKLSSGSGDGLPPKTV